MRVIAAAAGVRKAGGSDDRVDVVGLFEKTDLVRDLERARRRIEAVAQHQDAADRIEPAA